MDCAGVGEGQRGVLRLVVVLVEARREYVCNWGVDGLYQRVVICLLGSPCGSLED